MLKTNGADIKDRFTLLGNNAVHFKQKIAL